MESVPHFLFAGLSRLFGFFFLHSSLSSHYILVLANAVELGIKKALPDRFGDWTTSLVPIGPRPHFRKNIALRFPIVLNFLLWTMWYQKAKSLFSSLFFFSFFDFWCTSKTFKVFLFFFDTVRSLTMILFDFSNLLLHSSTHIENRKGAKKGIKRPHYVCVWCLKDPSFHLCFYSSLRD